MRKLLLMQGGVYMNEKSGLEDALRVPGSGADLVARNMAGLVRLEPLTRRAEQWLHKITSGECSWDADAIVIELRYFPAIADGAIAAGLTFERSSQPN